MPRITSTREKNLWYWALLVVAAIFATLFLGRPLANLEFSQNVAAGVFITVMALIAAAILIHAIKTKPSKRELVVIIGIVAVYIMFFLRLGIPERSHLMEYSVLAIFIHMALLEREKQRAIVWLPPVSAFLLTFSIGLLDELLQIVIPDRVFDLYDIVFNGFAAFMAIAARVILQWTKRKITK